MSEVFNLWNTGIDFLQWRIEWDHITEFNDFNRLVSFAIDFLEIGKEEGIYWLVDVETGALAHDDYIHYLKREVEERQELPLFAISDGPIYSKSYDAYLYRDRYKILSHVCYFDQKGNVVEAALNDLGSVFESVTPFDPDWHDPLIYEHFVGIKSLALSVQGNRFTAPTKFSKPWLTITLNSSMWFPWVKGNVLDLTGNVLSNYGGMWDNRVLANCHTPRLNNFLQGVRSLAEKSGGRWQVELKDNVLGYEFMSEETGIRLYV